MTDKTLKTSQPMSDSMYLSVTARAATAYNRVAIDARAEVASPHELINMLFDGVLAALSQAQGAMERADAPSKNKALTKAIRLIGEGLRASLDPQGGDLTVNLDNLYGYCCQRLTEANLRNDLALVLEVRKLIQTVADGWKQIDGATPETPRS
jgi:flagellar protein FliS